MAKKNNDEARNDNSVVSRTVRKFETERFGDNPRDKRRATLLEFYFSRVLKNHSSNVGKILGQRDLVLQAKFLLELANPRKNLTKIILSKYHELSELEKNRVLSTFELIW